MSDWTHFDQQGKPMMVNVGEKLPTRRRALAEGWVRLTPAICAALEQGGIKKGDPLPISELAGIMGAKQTSQLIPLCHQIALDSVSVRCEYLNERQAVRITCEALTHGVTGVEMEALTGVSVAALVLYDMCKGIDKGMVLTEIRLLEKSGGKSGEWRSREEKLCGLSD